MKRRFLKEFVYTGQRWNWLGSICRGGCPEVIAVPEEAVEAGAAFGFVLLPCMVGDVEISIIWSQHERVVTRANHVFTVALYQEAVHLSAFPIMPGGILHAIGTHRRL